MKKQHIIIISGLVVLFGFLLFIKFTCAGNHECGPETPTSPPIVVETPPAVTPPTVVENPPQSPVQGGIGVYVEPTHQAISTPPVITTPTVQVPVTQPTEETQTWVWNGFVQPKGK